MTKEYDGDILYIILYYVDKKKVRFRKTCTCVPVVLLVLYGYSIKVLNVPDVLDFSAISVPHSVSCSKEYYLSSLQVSADFPVGLVLSIITRCMCTKIARKSLYQLRKSAITNCKKNLMKLNRNL